MKSTRIFSFSISPYGEWAQKPYFSNTLCQPLPALSLPIRHSLFPHCRTPCFSVPSSLGFSFRYPGHFCPFRSVNSRVISSSIFICMCFFFADTLPTLSSVVRGPAGRYVWTMQLRQFSREKNVVIHLNVHHSNNCASIQYILQVFFLLFLAHPLYPLFSFVILGNTRRIFARELSLHLAALPAVRVVLKPHYNKLFLRS